MKVIVNGCEEELIPGTTVSGLLKRHHLISAHVVVELNENIIKKDSFYVTELEAGDKVEILRFVGGG